MCFRPPSFNQLMSRCPECNVFNPPTNKTCKKCGAVLPEPAPEESNTNNAKPAAPQVGPKRTNPNK